MRPEPSLTGVRLAIPDHAIGLPVLRALSLCTCCCQYPGTATDGTSLLIPSVVSAFPRRAAGSACASSFSRLIQRSLALRPAHSRCHQNLWPAIRRLQPFRYLHDCSGCFRLEHFAGWGFHPLEKAPPLHGARPLRSLVVSKSQRRLTALSGHTTQQLLETASAITAIRGADID